MILHDFSLTCFQGKLLITFHLFHRMLCVDYANRNIWLPVLREWMTPDDSVGLIYRRLNLLHKINSFVKISFRSESADGHLDPTTVPHSWTDKARHGIKGGGVAIGNPDSVNSININSINTFQLIEGSISPRCRKGDNRGNSRTF